MNDDLVKFLIPASFVIERVILTPAELAFGYREGWIGDSDVVLVASATFEYAGALKATLEELSLLLSDDFSCIPEILGQMSEVATEIGRPSDVWLFLALSWLHENRANYQDPLQLIEMIYADFEYPDEIQGFVRFMPTETGSPVGLDVVERNWETFLNRKQIAYRKRQGGN